MARPRETSDPSDTSERALLEVVTRGLVGGFSKPAGKLTCSMPQLSATVRTPPRGTPAGAW